MPQFFNLGHCDKRVPNLDYPWPYDIDVCFDDIENPIAFREGEMHGAYGTNVSIQDAIGPTFSEYFEITKSQWLIPFLERSAQGAPLPKEEIFDIYWQLHRRIPESYESVPFKPTLKRAFLRFLKTFKTNFTS